MNPRIKGVIIECLRRGYTPELTQGVVRRNFNFTIPIYIIKSIGKKMNN